MPIAKPIELEPLERDVLAYLTRAAGQERTFDQVVEEIQSRAGNTDGRAFADRVVGAVFRLVRLELVELTPDRRLRAIV